MVKLKFCRAWRGYSKGQTAELPGGLAQQLLAQRVAVHDNQQPLIQTAAIEHATETADVTPRKRGRRAIPKPYSPDAADG